MKPEVKLMWSTPDSEFQIVRAARVCYQSEDKSDSHYVIVGLDQASDGNVTIKYPVTAVALGPNDKSLLEKIMTNNHNACLRFSSAAFNIKGISRVCSHQLVRIAHFGILQKSQRYCDEDGAGFVFPESFDDTIDSTNVANYANAVYNDLISVGVKEEDARYVLPGAVETEINMCANFQGWKHFLKIRLSKKVQPETFAVAAEVCKQLYKLAPIVFRSDYENLQALSD